LPCALCAQAAAAAFSPPLSQTYRPHRWGGHAAGGSRATLDFPQNSFVWEIKKIDSRPARAQPDHHGIWGVGRGRAHARAGWLARGRALRRRLQGSCRV